MGAIDLNFRPSVPVFDANIALGRHNKRFLTSDSLAQAEIEMDRIGVGRALAYSMHAAVFDTEDGNEYLMDILSGNSSIEPQFVCNFATDNLNRFADEIEKSDVRSLRILPNTQGYPFVDWIIGEWMEWLSSTSTPLWIPSNEVPVEQLYNTLKKFPDVNVVLSEVHYVSVPWVLPMLKKLHQVNIEISRFVIPDGISTLIDTAGSNRILFGSRFPDSPIGPQLYNLEKSILNKEILSAICSGNLKMLLNGSKS